MNSSQGKKLWQPVFSSFFMIFLCAGPAAGWGDLALPQNHDQASEPGKSEKKPAPRRKAVVPDYSKFELEDPAKLKSEPMQIGASRGGPQLIPIPLAPHLGKVYSLQPQFAWAYDGPARVFLLIVYREDLTELYRMGAATNPFIYPAEAPALDPNKKYFWSVEVLAEGANPAPPALAGFVVAAGEERAEIEKALTKISAHSSYEQALGRARLFADRAFWYDAIAAFSDLIAQHPERPELLERRGQIYAQLKITEPLAERDLARSAELRRRNKPRNR